MSSVYEPTEQTTVKRLPARGVYDREVVHQILDEALICHLGFVVDGQPFVIPTIHVRVGETIFVHGSPASRMLRTLEQGVPACLTVTHVDGLVLARSAFHHSMNYRSVVVLGTAKVVDDSQKKFEALHALDRPPDAWARGKRFASPAPKSCAERSYWSLRSRQRRPRSGLAHRSMMKRTTPCQSGPVYCR